jgi:CRISPR system Cascade subunit CasC
MLIEVHMIKNYAPSNLNRDDTGSPKSCIFGGEPRGRISSQCLKRNLRISEILQNSLGKDLFGKRTRKLPDLLAMELERRGMNQDFIEAAMKKASGFGNKEGKENDELKTAQIMFFSPADVTAVADCFLDAWKEAGENLKDFNKIKAKDLQDKMKDIMRPVTLDIALFGRMITSNAFRDVEASIQVAHAISTNRLEREFDYYTAMDDLLKSGEETGAGMVGDTEFNSNCYYHYFSLDLNQLIENLKGVKGAADIAVKAVPALVRAFCYVSPSGKQNSFAAHQLPSAVCVEIKDEKIPVSYANAFVKTASPGWKGDGLSRKQVNLIEDSVEKLVKEITNISRKFDIKVYRRLWFIADDTLPSPENALVCESFGIMLTKLEEALAREVMV